MIRWAIAVIAVMAHTGCAAHTIWLAGNPPVLEDYAAVHVRIYRVGPHCRLEVITATDSIVTLPTRCLTVPHITR